MLLLHLKQALRSLRKNKIFSFFNIAGFAIGFAVCIIIVLFAYRENSVNSFFPDAKNTYRLVDETNKTNIVDNAIAPILKERFPEIVKLAPLAYIYSEDIQESIKIGDKYMEFKEMVSTTNDFFDLAGIKLLSSKLSTPFVDKSSVIISKSAAMKLFGNVDIIDEPVRFFGIDFTVSAVADDIPHNATIGADVYINDEFTEVGFMQNCNNENDCYLIREIYFTVQKGTDINLLTQKINDNFPENRTKTKLVSLQSVKSIYFATPFESGFSQDKTGNRKLLWIFISIAALTLFMSVFNYVNYTISKQLATLKETGIRIASGAEIKQILGYYFVEVCLSVLIAFALALLIADRTLPLAENMLDTTLQMQWILKPEIIGVFTVLLFIVIALSVWFPVGIISRAKVTSLLSKTPKRIKAGVLSKAMSVVQLTISILLLSSLLVINKQLNFVKTADYGFHTEHLLQVNIPFDYNNYTVLKESFSKLPFIKNLSLTSHAPGAGWSRSGEKNSEGEEVLINTMNVDEDFVKTFEIKLLSGRAPEKTELGKSILITETTLKQLGWDDYEGKQVFKRNVTGIVNFFQYNSMHSLVGPVAFLFRDEYYSSLNVRLLPGNLSDQITQMKEMWKNTGIEQPFQFQFYDEYFNRLYNKEDREAKALTVFSIIAFIITCLGLLGQIMQTTERRVKEIGIRKINGAGIKEVMSMLNKEFIVFTLASFVIAAPIAYYIMNVWLKNFAYKTELSWWIFALSGFIALAITLITVSFQSWRAASRNPVEALRYE